MNFNVSVNSGGAFTRIYLFRGESRRDWSGRKQKQTSNVFIEITEVHTVFECNNRLMVSIAHLILNWILFIAFHLFHMKRTFVFSRCRVVDGFMSGASV